MKKTRSAYRAGPRDCCQTPAYALEPLLPYLPKESVIWEPACGEGLLWAYGTAYYGLDMIRSDILHPEVLLRANFLTTPCPYNVDLIVTNPPWSHPAKGRFIARCYELGKPFALLVPCDTIGSKSFQEAAKPHGFELLLLDERIDFFMPNKGYTKGGADLPVMWICWKLLPAPVVFGHVNKPEGM